jgi:hypothetical protein
MTKTKESVERVEDLKAQVRDLLGVDAMMDEDVTKNMKETLITLAKSDGEEHIEEVIDTIEKALEKIKNPEFKAIIASIIWTKCPIGMQKSCIEHHNEMLNDVMAAHMEKQTEGNPLLGLALLAAALENKL